MVAAVTGPLSGQKTLEDAAVSTITELAECFRVASRNLTF